MAGLTSGGFVPETLTSIKGRIEAKIDAVNPGFDLSPESPDGQLVGTMSFELAQAWAQLNLVYNSYNPQVATGAALRNLGLITGQPYGSAKRSYATLETQGVAGTVIPSQSKVTINGNEFYTSFEVTIPANIQVIASLPGPVPVPALATVEVVTAVAGWTGSTITNAGVEGSKAMNEQQYRNFRQQTVMRNYTSTADTMRAKLLELGLMQASVINNDSLVVLPDGTPAGSIHVVLGELGTVTRADAAKVILSTNALGVPTHTTTADYEDVKDSQGYTHRVYFSVAVEVPIEIDLDVTFLDANVAGAKENVENSLLRHVNALLSGEDVIWSRLFGYVLPYAKAQINSITINKVGDAAGVANIPITGGEFASLTLANLNLVVT